MFHDQSSYPIQFPLMLQQPILLYQEQSEGTGHWSTVKYLEFQVPSKWDLSGEIVDHRSFFIFNVDIQLQFENVQQQGLFRESQQSSELLFTVNNKDDKESIQNRYSQIQAKQKALFISTNFNQRSEILLIYSTDLHFCNSFEYLAKKPYKIENPPGVNVNNYKFIFFKRYEKEELLLDIIGISKNESKMDAVLGFLMQKLVYEVRYSKEGIKKQVEDSVDRILLLSLKQILRYIGKVMNIVDYKRMIELLYQIFVQGKDDFQFLFRLREESPLFCKHIRILKRDIESIVYKVMIAEGLLPIQIEINTMNDSYLKLKLLSLVTDSEVLPWSPKFHASIALGNFHYSFTPNDLFNLRTLLTRKYNKNYQYTRIRVLDFFPLDKWVLWISEFFEENLYDIVKYLGECMGIDSIWKKNEDDIKLTKSAGIREPLLKRHQMDSVCSEKDRSNSNHQIKESRTETEMISDNIRTLTNLSQSQLPNTKKKQSKQSLSITNEFRPREYVLETPNFFLSNQPDENHQQQFQLFKKILKRSLQRITHKTNIYDIIVETPLIQQIKTNIANEFYSTYHYELEVTGILNQFCSIITETELRSYSTLVNNCQTPVAAFIYMICDTFRPYSESLDPQNTFLLQCKEEGYKFDFSLESKDLISRTRTNELTDLNNVDRDFLKNKGQNKSQFNSDEKAYPYKAIYSNNILSQVSQVQYSDVDIQMRNYLQFASTYDLIMMGKQFISPAVLNQALDYFGFYGDKLSSAYLKTIQGLDQDLSSFYAPQQKKGFFKRNSDRKRDSKIITPLDEEIQFAQSFKTAQDFYFSNFQRMMLFYEKSESTKVFPTMQCEINQILGYINETTGQKDQNIFEKQEQYEPVPIHIHFLLMTYQNKMIQLKQIEEVNSQKHAYIRHNTYELFMEACFLYYNSIRMQLKQKQRKNTLSYIGFVVAKDLDRFYPHLPENVTLQTL